jgi:hypothetical protein
MRVGYPDPSQDRLLVHVDGRPYTAHRLAWLYMTGDWPPPGLTVDHKDTDGRNNAWRNLRLATQQQQQFNRSKQKRNTTGYKGVTYSKKKGLYCAFIGFNRKGYNLGGYATAKMAHAAYANAARRLHGEFARVT